VEALGAGDVPKAVELFRPEYAEKLSVAGTPEECIEKIKADIEPAGVNHMVLALSDAGLVKLFSGEEVPNVPDINGQLRLVAERMMPAFAPAVH
jgi:5,10-methylenetetrahydromethanopterin reductase